MKRILITGGAGFIASHTIQAALQRGYDVVTNVRDANASSLNYLDESEYDRVSVYPIDMRDEAGIYSLVEKVDGVIHLAGLLGTKNVNQSWLYYDINVRGALNLLEACTNLNVPMVGIAVGNWFETNNYSNSKFAAEREMLKYARYRGTRVNIVRGLNAYGERQKVIGTGKIIPTFITQALNSEPIHVYGGQDACGVMDMVEVGDVANVLLNVLEQTNETPSYGNVYEAGTGVGLSVWDIAQTIVAKVRSKSEILAVPMRNGESERSVVVAQNPYPYPYLSLDEAIDNVIAWYVWNSP